MSLAETERKTKEAFEEISEKQMKAVKYSLFFSIGGVGAAFTFIGLLFALLNIKGDDGEALAPVFIPLGLVLMLVGVIAFVVTPKKLDYTKYCVRHSKSVYLNSYEMPIHIRLTEERTDELERRVAELEEKLAALEKKENDRKKI